MNFPKKNAFSRGFNILLALLLSFLALTACTVKPTANNSVNNIEVSQENRPISPAYAEALAKSKAVQQSKSPQERGLRLLEEAEAWQNAKEFARAEAALARSQRFPLSKSDKNFQQWLYFGLFLQSGRQEAAENAYQAIDGNLLPSRLQASYQERAAAFQEQQGNRLAAVTHLIALEALLTDNASKKQLAEKIFQLLRSTPKSEIIQALDQKNGEAFQGWLLLVRDIYDLRSDDPAYLKALRLWQQQQPAHPANDAWLPAYQQEIAALLPIKEKIAVLLPLSGRFAEFAQAIRHGMRLAHRQTTEKSDLVFYDTNKIGVINAYQQALAEGASKIIGPLQKTEIDALVTAFPVMPVPTLALNQRSQNDAVIADLFEFALLPEDEVAAVVAKATMLGREQILLIVPNDAWGKRIDAATKAVSTYVDNVQTVFYPGQTRDFSATAQQARQKLLLPEASSIFIIAKRPVAQLLVSALKEDPLLATLPIFSTSYLDDGKRDPINDIELNGLLFCDLPWVYLPKPQPPVEENDPVPTDTNSEAVAAVPEAPLEVTAEVPLEIALAMAAEGTLEATTEKAPEAPLDPIVALYQQAWQEYPSSMEKHPRLVAFGLDAYRLQQALPLLAEPLRGITGELSRNQQSIVRGLSWYYFENAEIIPE